MKNNYPAEVILGCLDSTEISSEEREFIREESPAGVTLFGRNIPKNFTDLKVLLQDLQSLRSKGEPPFIVAIDQEGGRVRRIKEPFPNEGPARDLKLGKTESQSIDFINEYGKTLADSLLRLGVNVNFAPVVDCLTNSENHAIGDRSFSSCPYEVSKLAGAFQGGLHKGGIISCLKHFPGQGDANFDTHHKSAQITLSLDELEKRELIPFINLLPNSPMVMIAHCIYPQIDDAEASLSKVIMQDLLRGRLNYNGVIVTDDMTMGAIANKDCEWVDLIIKSIANGSDLVLVCKGLDLWKEATDALRSEAQTSKIFALRLEEAAHRVRALRSKIINYHLD